MLDLLRSERWLLRRWRDGEHLSFTVPGNVASRRVTERLGMARDPGEDFDHPALPLEHPLRRHVPYRIRRS